MGPRKLSINKPSSLLENYTPEHVKVKESQVIFRLEEFIKAD